MSVQPEPSRTIRTWRCGRYQLLLRRPLVMGIVNITPDSFSDGGLHHDTAAAVAAARQMVADGADILDLGAESTRPGADPVSVQTEWERLEPVIRALQDIGRPLSIDTRRAEVMNRALALGVDIINDVSGFRDPENCRAVAAHPTVGVCIMHMQGEPSTMQQAPHYRDVVGEVRSWLAGRVAALRGLGVQAERICTDPGFGFGKTLHHNLRLLAELEATRVDGLPILVGVSRKSMIGAVTGQPVEGRMAGSIGGACTGWAMGGEVVRVHDVRATVDALRVAHAVATVRHQTSEDANSFWPDVAEWVQSVDGSGCDPDR